MRLSSFVLFALIAALNLSACGGSSSSPVVLPPVAAPPCPPSIGRVIALEQITDADRDNGRVTPDLGRVPRSTPFVGDPAIPGSLIAMQQRFGVPRPADDIGASNSTIYIPSPDGAVVAEGTFPLVVVMPGFGATHAAYAAYSTHIASHGFIVLGLDTDDGGFVATSDHALEARRVGAAIDWMLEESPVAEVIDASKIAVAGHSKGGKVGFWAAALDDRIDLVIGWDPSNSGGAPCIIDPENCNSQPAAPNCNTPNGDGIGVLHQMRAETLVIGVPPDALTNPDPAHNALNFYRGAPSPAAFIQLDGSHLAFLTGDPLLVREVTIRATTGQLLQRFQGRRIEAQYLPGGAEFAPADFVLPPLRMK